MNRPYIIGITGKKFNGKDTIADYLVKKYGYTKLAFGDSLKKCIQQLFSFTYEQVHTDKKEEIDSYWHHSPREFMQFIGTELLRDMFSKQFPDIGEMLFVKIIDQKIKQFIENGIYKIVICDVRFPNEEKLIRNYSGIIIKVTRPSIITVDHHISENLEIYHDFILINDKLEQLYKNIDCIIKRTY